MRSYLIEQRQAAGDPLLQLDNGDKVALLAFILAGVAQRQRVILSTEEQKVKPPDPQQSATSAADVSADIISTGDADIMHTIRY